ncbi:hypothetical protein G3I01_15845 [Gramella sp. MT6]|uniref:hypothetical protein n=1 Tax=Gramella sp. MT6 TaxID=2705471 RepID=UPI001C5F7B21|nr:hypothetical protein [Gramella sp. MT6]QYA26906.1 hypothetical protein G3I01_15845 [Gramella sp. MT6]
MKKFIQVFIPILIGLILIGLSIWFFFLAKNDNAYLLLFGLGTAIFMPISISLFQYAASYRKRNVNQKLSELSKIADIKDLLDKTKSTEEQLEILKNEYKNLEKNIRYNSEKIALELRRDDLIRKAKETLRELESIDEELIHINANLEKYNVPLEVQLLRERVFKKEIAVFRFREKTYTYKKYTAPNSNFLPLDDILFLTFKTIERTQKKKLKEEVDESINN